jgi:6-phosphogluconolactonase
MTTPKVHVSPDLAALAGAVADWLLQSALETVGPFSLCLSGGSTPKALYRLLAGPPYRDRFPWYRTHLFWGDERFVPPDDELSNYRMVREALLDNVPIPPGNIHAVPTQGSNPQAAAAAYQRDLRGFYGADRLESERPLFDATLLGLGPDGHTASLFPDTEVLDDRRHWVAAVIGAKAEARITLTYPALESSRHAAFLVAGADKAAILRRLMEGDQSLPAARLQPTGSLWVFRDVAVGGDA